MAMAPAAFVPRRRRRVSPRAAGPEDLGTVPGDRRRRLRRRSGAGPRLVARASAWKRSRPRSRLSMANPSGRPRRAQRTPAGPALDPRGRRGRGRRAAPRHRGGDRRRGSWRGVAAGARLVHLHAASDAAARVYARLGFADAPPLDVYVAAATAGRRSATRPTRPPRRSGPSRPRRRPGSRRSGRAAGRRPAARETRSRTRTSTETVIVPARTGAGMRSIITL